MSWPGLRLARRPDAALLCQIFAQAVYLVLVFQLTALPRDLWQLGLVIGFCLALDLVLQYLSRPGRGPLLIAFSTWAIANSTFINSETFSPWGLLACAALAMGSRHVFVDQRGRHIFNPSMFGIVAAVVLFPGVASMGLRTFGDFWPINLVVILVGGITVILARSWMIVLSYEIAFVLVSLVYNGLAARYQLLASWEPARVGPWFWAVTQLSIGSMIFAFAVISDPRTAPRRRLHQLFFGLTIALLDFFFRKCRLLMPEAFAYLLAQALWSIVNTIREREESAAVFSVARGSNSDHS